MVCSWSRCARGVWVWPAAWPKIHPLSQIWMQHCTRERYQCCHFCGPSCQKMPGRWGRATEGWCGWQWFVQVVRERPSCVTPMFGTWDLMNLPGHHKDTQQQVKLPLESFSFVANPFRGPKVIHYLLHSGASPFLALLHKTVPTTPWIQALYIWKLEAKKMNQEEGVIRVEMSY